MAVLRKKERKDLHRVDVLGSYKTINERISRITETRWTLDNDMRKKARGTSGLIDHFRVPLGASFEASRRAKFLLC